MTTTKTVIVRCYSAGVHYGHLVSRDGDSVVLRDARRCWRWYIDHERHGTSQVTCSELAVYGPHGNSRIAAPVAEITLLGAIEVIDCTAAAAAAIEGWSL